MNALLSSEPSLYQVIQAWPEQLTNQNFSAALLEAGRRIRLGNILESEILLSCHPNLFDTPEAAFLRYIIDTYRAKPFDASKYTSFANQDSDSIYSRFLYGEICLARGEIADINGLPVEFWHEDEASQILFDLKNRSLLRAGKPYLVIERIENLRKSNTDISIFTLRSLCYALGRLGEYRKAVEFLDEILVRCPNDFLVHLQLVDFIFKMEDGNRALKVLRNALDRFGSHPDLLLYATTAKLHQREPGVACKIKLIEKTKRSVTFISSSEHDANLLNAYDHLGRAEWLQFVNKRIVGNVLSNIDLHANLMMQLSSIASPLYKQFCIEFLSSLRSHEPFKKHLNVEPLPLSPVELPRDTSRGLKILWVTGDIANHPVCRFF